MKIRGKRLVLYFVIKDEYRNENDVSDEMQLAYMNALDWNLRPNWIRESEIAKLPDCSGNILVLEEFQDDMIEELTKTRLNLRIVGPRCILNCHMERIAIPNTPFPTYNMAMNNLVVCTSNIPEEERKEIRKLVGYMGGNFTNPLTVGVTHLIVPSAFTKKHFIACENGMTPMKKGWVERVWELNSKDNVKAIDYNIIQEYKCPIFYNINITSSLVSVEEKAIISEQINQNGGTYSPDLINKVTNVLIVPRPEGSKFRHAVRWKIPCIKPAWIEVCLERGHTVDYEKYIVQSCSEISSTPIPKPVPQKQLPFNDTNESEISFIPSHNEKNIVNESEPKIDILTMERSLKANEASVFKTPSKAYPKNSQPDKVSQYDISLETNLTYQKILQDIEVSEIKKCGPIFDGCKLYLAGFNSNEEEKLRKVLNYGGALRFTELNESITHVVVGNPNSANLQQLEHIPNKPHVVKIDWLCNSIKNKSLAKENTFVYIPENEKSQPKETAVPQQPSPLSKKGFQVLNPALAIEKPNTQRVPIIDRNLIEKYSQEYAEPHRPEPPEPIPVKTANHTTQVPDDPHSTALSTTLFTGLKFAIVGHDLEATETFKNTVIEYGGNVVTNNRSVVDYAIVPLINTPVKVTSNEIVTIMWLEDCLFNMRIMDVKYYHLPIDTDIIATKPLSDCVITFTSYDRHEKQYLENLAKLLGAKCQEVLSKKITPSTGILQTTHLICAAQQGNKYEAAKKWKLPIVTEMWIRDCFRQKTMLPVENYLIGESKSSLQTSNVGAKNTNYQPSNSRQIPEPSKGKAPLVQHAVPNETMLNFRAVATSTKIGDITKDISICDRNTKSKATKHVEQITPTTNVHSANIISGVNNKPDTSSANSKNKQNETSKTSKMSNGPTSLLLEMNASSERSCSGLKRKSRNEPADRKHRSPKKKAICLDKRSLSPVDEIGWQDTLTDLSHYGGPTSGGSNSQKNTDNILEKIPHPEENIQPVIHRNIMLSLDEDKKQQLEDIVKRLGGVILAAYESDCKETERATHLIADQLKKTEKVLCSIASGIWVLHSSYLEDCHKEGKFLPEEDYELGNPKNEKFLVNATLESKSLVQAARRKRLLIKEGGPSKRPFVDWKVVIISPTNDGIVHSLMRVVKSGGGEILQYKDILKSTHCLMKNNNCVKDLPVPLELLARHKIHCLPAVYLRDYLILHPPPDPTLRYISEYQQFFK